LPDRLAVVATEGQFFKVTVQQTGVDVVVTLREPGGHEVMTSALPSGYFGSDIVAAVVASSREYIIEVKLDDSHTTRGSYDAVLDFLRDATPADRELAAAYRMLSNATALRKQLTPEARRQVVDLLNRAASIFARTGDGYARGWTLILLWSMAIQSGDIQPALRYAEEAIEVFHSVGDERGEAQARNIAGGMLDLLGEPERARYREALVLGRATGDRARQADELNNIAKLEGDQGNWQVALDNYRQALALAQQAGDISRQGACTHNIGTSYLRIGEFDEALSIYEQALVLRRQGHDVRGEAETLEMIGNTCAARKEPEKALDYLHQALAAETAMGDRRKEAELRRNLASVDATTGQLHDAEQELRQSVQGSRAVKDRRNAALAARDRSNVSLRENRPAEALSTAEEALGEFRAIGDRPSEATALEAMAGAEDALGKLAAARGRMEETLRLTEQSR
jgi:tetratricopeptide (TPR) repeat protein